MDAHFGCRRYCEHACCVVVDDANRRSRAEIAAQSRAKQLVDPELISCHGRVVIALENVERDSAECLLPQRHYVGVCARLEGATVLARPAGILLHDFVRRGPGQRAGQLGRSLRLMGLRRDTGRLILSRPRCPEPQEKYERDSDSEGETKAEKEPLNVGLRPVPTHVRHVLGGLLVPLELDTRQYRSGFQRARRVLRVRPTADSVVSCALLPSGCWRCGVGGHLLTKVLPAGFLGCVGPSVRGRDDGSWRIVGVGPQRCDQPLIFCQLICFACGAFIVGRRRRGHAECSERATGDRRRAFTPGLGGPGRRPRLGGNSLPS